MIQHAERIIVSLLLFSNDMFQKEEGNGKKGIKKGRKDSNEDRTDK
jgi:hypothetical protein